MRCCRVHVTGVVQGVGFRPYLWNRASELGLAGWVRNTSSGVEVFLEGEEARIEALLRELRTAGPPLARIDAIRSDWEDPQGLGGFAILPSQRDRGVSLSVSPDVATCDDCLRELWDPQDRRFRYPFINCTHCGPRFTIIEDIPYDRPRTTMAPFRMCAACAAEYDDPGNRRFHAQPVACPGCGPQVWLEEDGVKRCEADEALAEARRLLAAGAIVAVKGLGGFHLACDATHPEAVGTLRLRKHREAKPFALMAPSLSIVRRHGRLSPAAQALLESPERPVILLERLPQSTVVSDVAPGRRELGFMLPYTPLHHLLLERAAGFPEVLVMTSANHSDEPIAFENDEARARLRDIADVFLLHPRRIHIRCDDSVATEFRGKVYFLRRSRGYTPLPLTLPLEVPPLLALGGEMKNVFCLARGRRAILSHHIGELQYLETWRSFRLGLQHFQRLFGVDPEVFVHDLQPDFQSTRHALRQTESRGHLALGVQHHHAHVAACMADHGLGPNEKVLGVAFDGMGYGMDGTIWGGEFLVATYDGFERAMSLKAVPLPGGDAATRKPARMALAWMHACGLEWDEALAPVRALPRQERQILARQLQDQLHAPLTSSVGRLFDAVAALVGLCQRITYEAQAACELEAAAAEGNDVDRAGAYVFELTASGLDPTRGLHDLVRDVRRGVPVACMAARFHRGLARAVVEACAILRRRTGLERVALSGGVWQNRVLLRQAVAGLEEAGFTVLVHQQVPANDGGLAFGQVAVAAARLRRAPSVALQEGRIHVPGDPGKDHRGA